MRKSTIFSVLIAFCLVLFVGCATAPAAVGPTIPEIAAKQTAQQTQINTMNANKADAATVNALTTRVTTLEGQSAANTYTKTQLYTRAEIDVAIADAIEALKDDQDWITGRTSTSSSGTTTGEWGELLDEDGDLELWLERSSGDVSDEFRTRKGENSGRFDLIVVNLDDSSHDFRLYLDFEPDAAVELSANSTYFDTTLTEAESSGGLTFTASRSPNTARSLLSFDQSNNGRILKGDAEDYTIWVTIHQLTDKVLDWDYDIRIRDKD